jgi:hypothetical protein
MNAVVELYKNALYENLLNKGYKNFGANDLILKLGVF